MANYKQHPFYRHYLNLRDLLWRTYHWILINLLDEQQTKVIAPGTCDVKIAEEFRSHRLHRNEHAVQLFPLGIREVSIVAIHDVSWQLKENVVRMIRW